MRRNVLLIEHDRELATQLGRGLHEAGFAVMVLQDADEAIDLLRLATFDLILANAGTLRYSAARNTGLVALLQVVRNAPLLRFTTPVTMGPAGSTSALVLDYPVLDLPRLLDAINALFYGPATPIAVLTTSRPHRRAGSTHQETPGSSVHWRLICYITQGGNHAQFTQAGISIGSGGHIGRPRADVRRPGGSRSGTAR